VLERGEVDLAQRALVHVGADPRPGGFLVVPREVFDAAADLLRLQPGHGGRGHPAGQVRILGQILEVAPAQRRALDVDPGAQDDRDALRPRLGTEGGPHLAGQVRIPGGRQRRRGGKARGGHAGEPSGAVPWLWLFAQPVRPVRHHDRLDAEFTDRRGVPEVRAETQGGLLRHAQLGDRGG